jgi:hypothetical protein
MDKKLKAEKESQDKPPVVYGDPEYSANDDIYSKGAKVKLQEAGDDLETIKKVDKKTLTGEDLDIPGAELDDTNEEIGEEDEENNYYSLGGDDHDDLEDDKA